ncbi:hypothetical protein MEC_00199 [Bartonella alsatica IBS 382]|uniref:Uncharacterized protein n=1 Tax=Bartonella alsatica IBS 382 TaxID=1094551 RepID=J0PZI8_9HYPH|nr:hypothetical protein MEC_00199 [Bartonella alsatica IBS 382]
MPYWKKLIYNVDFYKDAFLIFLVKLFIAVCFIQGGYW